MQPRRNDVDQKRRRKNPIYSNRKAAPQSQPSPPLWRIVQASVAWSLSASSLLLAQLTNTNTNTNHSMRSPLYRIRSLDALNAQHSSAENAFHCSDSLYAVAGCTDRCFTTRQAQRFIAGRSAEGRPQGIPPMPSRPRLYGLATAARPSVSQQQQYPEPHPSPNAL